MTLRRIFQAAAHQAEACSLRWVNVEKPSGVIATRQALIGSMWDSSSVVLRPFSASSADKRRTYSGPVSFKQMIIALIVGAGVVSAAKTYNDQKVQRVMAQSQQVAGKAAVGGPFNLIDQDGKPFSDANLRGEFAVLYFGFTFCPDICPDELEKLSAAIDMVEKKTGVKVNVVFITVDPERDNPSKVKEYVREFHPRMIGLTGDLESIKRTSKQYRVFFHKTDDSATDYLVDHSIIHYLINPDGDFVTFYGKNFTAEAMADSLCEQLANWKKEHPEYPYPRT